MVSESRTGLMKKVIADEPELFNLSGLSASESSSGYNNVEYWDHYSTTQWWNGIQAYAKKLKMFQSVEVIPGSFAVTSKKFLGMTLKRAFGTKDASKIIPKSFSLPYEIDKFERHLALINYTGVWALKRDVHRGSGIDMVFGTKAAERARLGSLEDKDPYVTAQKVITDQYHFIGRHATNLRLLVAFSGGGGNFGVPRAYLFKGGYMRFGGEIPKRIDTEEEAQSLVVNFVSDSDLSVWMIDDLKNHWLKTTGSMLVFDQVWDNIKRSIASSLSSMVPAVRKISGQLRHYNGGTIGLLGIDIIFSSDMEPWIIEINSGPSFIQAFSNCSYTDKSKPSCPYNEFDNEKMRTLRSFYKVIRARWKDMEERLSAAHAAIKVSPKSCSINQEFLKNVMDSDIERNAAVGNDFEDLSPLLHLSLKYLRGAGNDSSLPNRTPSGGDGMAPGKIYENDKEAGYYEPTLADEILETWMQEHHAISAEETLRQLCQLEALQKETSTGGQAHARKGTASHSEL